MDDSPADRRTWRVGIPTIVRFPEKAPFCYGMKANLFFRFYRVKFNKIGLSMPAKFTPMALLSRAFKGKDGKGHRASFSMSSAALLRSKGSPNVSESSFVPPADARTILIATMEYDISDWAIKIKIGGLGVMAQVSLPRSIFLISSLFQLNS